MHIDSDGELRAIRWTLGSGLDSSVPIETKPSRLASFE